MSQGQQGLCLKSGVGKRCVRTTLGTSFRDTAVADLKGVLVLLDGGLEGGQGLEQLGLGAWEFIFGVCVRRADWCASW